MVGGDAGERGEMGGIDGGLATFGDLEATFDEEEGLGGDEELVLMEGVAWDEEVGDAGFVFEGDEAVAFGGGGALAADDHPGDGDGHAVGEGGEFAGGARCLLRRSTKCRVRSEKW